MIQLELPGMITDPNQYFRDMFCTTPAEMSDHIRQHVLETLGPNYVKPTLIQPDADYSALEARVYAEMAKDGRLRNYLSEYWPRPHQLELPLDSCGSQP